MESPHRPPTREQRIFNLGLGVEAVSLYLLCCGLADADQPLCLSTITPAWNMDHSALVANLDILLAQGILTADGVSSAEATRFRLEPSARWKNP